MRKFAYRYPGAAEYFIDVTAENNQLILSASFPTQSAMLPFFESDINNLLSKLNLNNLTAEEVEACKKVISDNIDK